MLDQCGELLHTLPLSTKAALLASVRRRAAGLSCRPGDAACSELDRCVLSLTDASQSTLDLAGLPLSDAAAVALAPRLTRVRALDVRRCSLLSGERPRLRVPAEACTCRLRREKPPAAHGLCELLAHSAELRVLRWGASLLRDYLRQTLVITLRSCQVAVHPATGRPAARLHRCCRSCANRELQKAAGSRPRSQPGSR